MTGRMTGIFSIELGDKAARPVVFGHGWDRSHTDFLPIAELIAHKARPILIDFPGFGKSPHPDSAWDTQDYANAVRTHLQEAFGLERFIWVGHSFGGRVGLRLAAMAKSPVEDMMIVAGAGVKRKRTLSERLKGKWKSLEFQRKKAAAKDEAALIALEKHYGSADYVRSREIGLRDIFVKTVQEDQSDRLPAIKCPTTLIYGAKDKETPPEIGRRLETLLQDATYLECPEFGHIDLLSRGRHQIATLLLEILARGDNE